MSFTISSGPSDYQPNGINLTLELRQFSGSLMPHPDAREPKILVHTYSSHQQWRTPLLSIEIVGEFVVLLALNQAIHAGRRGGPYFLCVFHWKTGERKLVCSTFPLSYVMQPQLGIVPAF